MSADGQNFVPPPEAGPVDELEKLKGILGPMASVFVKQFTDALQQQAPVAIARGVFDHAAKNPQMAGAVVGEIAKGVGHGIIMGLNAQYPVEAFDPDSGRHVKKVVTGAQLIQDLIDSNLELAASNEMTDEDEEDEEEEEAPRRRKR